MDSLGFYPDAPASIGDTFDNFGDYLVDPTLETSSGDFSKGAWDWSGFGGAMDNTTNNTMDKTTMEVPLTIDTTQLLQPVYDMSNPQINATASLGSMDTLGFEQNLPQNTTSKQSIRLVNLIWQEKTTTRTNRNQMMTTTSQTIQKLLNWYTETA